MKSGLQALHGRVINTLCQGYRHSMARLHTFHSRATATPTDDAAEAKLAIHLDPQCRIERQVTSSHVEHKPTSVRTSALGQGISDSHTNIIARNSHPGRRRYPNEMSQYGPTAALTPELTSGRDSRSAQPVTALRSRGHYTEVKSFVVTAVMMWCQHNGP